MSVVGIVVDVQHDFCANDGALAADGFPVERTRGVVGPINTMTAALREAGAPVIFLQSVYTRPDGRFIVPGMAQQAAQRWPWRGTTRPFLQEDSEGIELFGSLEVAPQDLIVRKWTHDGFYLSELQGWLTRLGATTVVMMGVTTDCCVLFTAQEAGQRGYRVIVPRDCVDAYDAKRHEAALEVLDWVVGSVVADAEVRDLVRRGALGTPAAAAEDAPLARAVQG